MDPARLAEAPGPAGRPRTWPHLPHLPRGGDAAADPPTRQARYCRPGRGAGQPQRLAARHGSADVTLAERPRRRAVVGETGRREPAATRPPARPLHARWTRGDVAAGAAAGA